MKKTNAYVSVSESSDDGRPNEACDRRDSISNTHDYTYNTHIKSYLFNSFTTPIMSVGVGRIFESVCLYKG